MATEDSIARQVRADIRRLRISWLNFQISRQQLIAASRQVDEAQFNLRSTTQASSNLTRDLLDALSLLLDAKNNLIQNWISYEIGRIALFVDLELLYLSDEGIWLNEDLNPGIELNRSSDLPLMKTSPAQNEPLDRPQSHVRSANAANPTLGKRTERRNADERRSSTGIISANRFDERASKPDSGTAIR